MLRNILLWIIVIAGMFVGTMAFLSMSHIHILLGVVMVAAAMKIAYVLIYYDNDKDS